MNDPELLQAAFQNILIELALYIINDDIKNVRKYFLPQSVNVVTCNPPYIKAQNLDKNKNDFFENIDD